MSRANKTASFNMTDELDRALLNHAEKINPLSGKKRNFSKYVKRLIEEDMKREQSGGKEIIIAQSKESIVNKEKDDYTIEAMSSYL